MKNEFEIILVNGSTNKRFNFSKVKSENLKSSYMRLLNLAE